MKQLTVLSLLLLMLLVPAYSSAQTASGSVTVTGTVVDEASLPLIGASVNVIGTKPPVGVIPTLTGTLNCSLQNRMQRLKCVTSVMKLQK